jgi:hypothetical protein
MEYSKEYLTVKLRVNPDGSIRPLSFIWTDGNAYKIERILHMTPAASTKVGGRGMRYTIVVEGKESYLFEEAGRWFMEVPRGSCI